MTIETRADGSRVHLNDPGEASSCAPRISINTEEGELLAFLARGKTVLEIGTGLGVSTRALASTARVVVTLDVDPWVQETIWPDLAWPQVIPLLSRESVRDVLFDMVFIDGDHREEAVISDMKFAVEHCPRGVIVVHDYWGIRGSLEDWEWQVIPTRQGVGICHVGWGS